MKHVILLELRPLKGWFDRLGIEAIRPQGAVAKYLEYTLVVDLSHTSVSEWIKNVTCEDVIIFKVRCTMVYGAQAKSMDDLY